ncbi:MAG: DNA polymerase-4 [Paraglaciecola psychrophila]|jgi:DNA polymerase-4
MTLLHSNAFISAARPSSAVATRKIIHCDADCFYAAVEIRDDPSLVGRAIAVGGAADRRGVISTCNYEARAFGVRSAMATATAKKLCPQLLILPSRFDAYREASQKMRDIFFDYSDKVEPLSLDEAFIDVSDTTACKGSATLMAEEIRQRIFEQTGLTVSAGVAPNKFLAKIGSDWNKPNGLCVITPSQVDAFVKQLPVDKIFGVGRVTAKKMHNLGIRTCNDLRGYDVYQLSKMFGSFGPRLHDLSYGRDQREVVTSRQRKSLSVEHTYTADLPSVDGCLGQLPALFMKLSSRLESLSGYRVTKQFVKVKFNNFQSTTMECVAQGVPRMAVFRDLCSQSYQRGDGLPVRLLGLGVRFQSHCDSGLQMSLFDEAIAS